ncbi:MAG: DinB family protein [candidate division Zixibacteria bacterium]|nr:DinB family protein [candidate division Zixibacteria bacterium]
MSADFRLVRPRDGEYAPYYGKYISAVPEGDILTTLAAAQKDMLALISGLTDRQASSRYEPGKWSVKEVIGHVIDSERVFAYRALRIARKDQTPLAGFEQDDYVASGEFDRRQPADLAQEFDHVRSATIDLLAHLSEEDWSRHGVANGFEVSVRALAWIIAGHELHHKTVLRSRYL